MSAGGGTAARPMPRSELMLTIYAPAMLLAFGQGILITTLPLYAADFTDSYSLISLIVSAAALGTLIMDVPAGAILGRLGLKSTMIGGTLLVVAGTLPLAFVHRFDIVLALRVIAGVGTAFWGLSRHALIASAVPVEQRGKVLSTYGGIGRIGVLLGPAAGGLIAAAAGVRISFVVSGLMALAALVLAVRYVQSVDTLGKKVPGRWGIVRRTMRDYARDLSAAGTAQTFGQMIRAGRLLIIPLYATNELGLGPAQVGLVMTASSAVDVVMFIPAGILMDRFGRKTASVPSFAVMAIGTAMIPLAHSFVTLMAVCLIIGAGNGLGSGAMMTLGADLAPRGATGEFLGIWRLIGDAGGFLGPIVVGVMAGMFSLQGSAYALALIGFAASLTLALLVRETRVSPAVISTA